MRSAQETIATTAQHAQTAQLQLAAHDQLLFTARQKVFPSFSLKLSLRTEATLQNSLKVDALSAQLVGLQAEVGISGETANINLPALLDKLKEPLQPNEQPKLPLLNSVNSVGSASYGYQSPSVKPLTPNWNDYKQYLIDQQKLDRSNAPPKLKRSNLKDDVHMSSEEMKFLLDWIHEENRKDSLMR